MNDITIETENQKRIVDQWYEALDRDYHMEDPEKGCPICYDAKQLGIIEDREPVEEGT